MMISYEDFTTCTKLSEWKSEHLEVNIINIETVSKAPTMYRVWYWTQNRNRNL